MAMNALEALQTDHDVTLLTLTSPDFEELNAYFNTDVQDVTVRKAGSVAPAIHERWDIKYYILQNALLGRYAKRHADEFDLLVSTINELGLEANSVQYVHFPFDWTVSLEDRDRIFHPGVEEESLYERLCTRIADVDRQDIRSNIVLANSEWTADAVQNAYGTRPRVFYPPVDTSEFDPRPWDQRENGLVTVGRIERSKRIDELIRIVDGVRERGHDVHFHVLGPTVDEEYRSELEEMVADRDYVYLEGEVSRSELVRRICTHKYGIHGKEFEHFGMAVAELAAGGTVTFAPNSGGQHVILDDNETQLYDSAADAVEKVSAVASDAAKQRTCRTTTAEIERRFGCERFRERFQSVVEEALARSTDGTATDLVARDRHSRVHSSD